MQRKSFASIVRNRFLFLVIFFAGLFITEFIFSFLLAFFFEAFHINFESTINPFSIFILFLRMVCLVLYIDFFRRISRYELEKDRLIPKFGRNIKLLGIGALCGGFSIALVQLLRYFLGLVSGFIFWDLKTNILLILGNILVTAFSVITEEMVHRKTIFLMLRNFGTPFWVSTCITSIIFALSHFLRNIGLMDVVFFFLFSVILCTLVENHKSIWLVIGIHTSWNLLADGGYLYDIDFLENTFSQIFSSKLISILVVLLVIIIYNGITAKRNKKNIIIEG